MKLVVLLSMLIALKPILARGGFDVIFSLITATNPTFDHDHDHDHAHPHTHGHVHLNQTDANKKAGGWKVPLNRREPQKTPNDYDYSQDYAEELSADQQDQFENQRRRLHIRRKNPRPPIENRTFDLSKLLSPIYNGLKSVIGPEPTKLRSSGDYVLQPLKVVSKKPKDPGQRASYRRRSPKAETQKRFIYVVEVLPQLLPQVVSQILGLVKSEPEEQPPPPPPPPPSSPYGYNYSPDYLEGLSVEPEDPFEAARRAYVAAKRSHWSKRSFGDVMEKVSGDIFPFIKNILRASIDLVPGLTEMFPEVREDIEDANGPGLLIVLAEICLKSAVVFVNPYMPEITDMAMAGFKLWDLVRAAVMDLVNSVWPYVVTFVSNVVGSILDNAGLLL